MAVNLCRGGAFRPLIFAGLIAATACAKSIDPSELPAPGAAGSARADLKRLTAGQYGNAVHDVLGDDIAVPAAIEPDVAAEGFLTVGGSVGGVSRRGVEQYETAAYQIATQALAPGRPGRDTFVGCAPAAAAFDDDCARAFVGRVGRKLWRRSLTNEETAAFVDVARQAGTTLGDFYKGLEYALAGLLQSPSFLFRVETGEPVAERPGLRRYTAVELASRLSFFLWNTTPDDELLRAAEAGELDTRKGLEAQVDRLIEAPRAREAVRNFFSELFHLQDLNDLIKDGAVFTQMSPDLAAAAKEETLKLVEDVVFERDAGYGELVNSRRTFVNRKLAALYGLPAPSLDGFGAVEHPESSLRRGILGQIGFLAMQAHPTSSSATLRGKFIQQVLLCTKIPLPPADVNTAIPEATEARPTMRERIAVHLEVRSCAQCHRIMDPIGLALETFDGIGAARTTENGARIDPSGELDGVPFSDARGLAAVVANHPRLAECAARKLFRYATGVVETEGNDPEIEKLASDFKAGGLRFKRLLRAVALTPGFRYAAEAN